MICESRHKWVQLIYVWKLRPDYKKRSLISVVNKEFRECYRIIFGLDVALSSLFDYEETVEVSQENQKLLPKCLTAHEDHLKKELDNSFINFHPKLRIMATVMYLICASGMAWVIRESNYMELSFLVFSIILILGLVGVEIFFLVSM